MTKFSSPPARAWLTLLLVAVVNVCAGAESAMADYRLHAGDKLDIAVWKELELKREIIIGPDGKFAFPLVGEVTAAGKNVTQVRTELETRLKKYIPEPVVTVLIAQVNGNVAYVIGQVTKPGSLVMNPAINVMQALSLAGGATPFAKLDSIIIIRNNQGAQRVLNFRYGQVSDGKNLDQNIQLESGDVVVVP